MTYTELEILYIDWKVENWGTAWTWELSNAWESILEQLIQEWISNGMSVEQTCARFKKLNSRIWSLVNERN